MTVKDFLRLVLASSKASLLTEEISVRGAIPEADQDDMTFKIQIVDGCKVEAPMPAEYIGVILKAFNEYRAGQRVLVRGVGKFSRNGRLEGFESIGHVSLLDPLDVPARLAELRNLKDGWLEGRGNAPQPNALDWLSRSFEQNFPDELPLPFLYPTAAGNVQAEWSIAPYEASLEIDLKDHPGEWHCLNLDSMTEETRILNLDEPQDWIWLADRIRALKGDAA